MYVHLLFFLLVISTFQYFKQSTLRWESTRTNFLHHTSRRLADWSMCVLDVWLHSYILYVGFDYTYIDINALAQGIKSFLASQVWFQAIDGGRTYGTDSPTITS